MITSFCKMPYPFCSFIQRQSLFVLHNVGTACCLSYIDTLVIDNLRNVLHGFFNLFQKMNHFQTTLLYKMCISTLNLGLQTMKYVKRGGMAELADVSVVHVRDLGSSLGTDSKYFLVLFVSHLNSNM
jgi:hypothetical protein